MSGKMVHKAHSCYPEQSWACLDKLQAAGVEVAVLPTRRAAPEAEARVVAVGQQQAMVVQPYHAVHCPNLMLWLQSSAV